MSTQLGMRRWDSSPEPRNPEAALRQERSLCADQWEDHGAPVTQDPEFPPCLGCSLSSQSPSQPGSKAEKDASLDAMLSFHAARCGERSASHDYGTSMPVVSQMELDRSPRYL